MTSCAGRGCDRGGTARCVVLARRRPRVDPAADVTEHDHDDEHHNHYVDHHAGAGALRSDDPSHLLVLPGIGIGFTDGVAWTHAVSAGKRTTGYNLTLVRRADRSLQLQGLASGRLHRRPDRGRPRARHLHRHRSLKCYRWCLTPSVTHSEFEDLQATVGCSCGDLGGARLGRADEQVSTVRPADGAREREL